MITKVFDVLFLVLGPILLATGLLSFSSSSSGREGESGAVRYYYDNDAVLMIAVGVGLIAFGTLRRHWLKERK